MNDLHVLFVHGLANKPPPRQLRRIWLDALRTPVPGDGGFDLGASGISDTFIYWADLFYDTPLPATDYENVSDELSKSLQSINGSNPSNSWVDAMNQRYALADTESPAPPTRKGLPEFERIPIPGSLKKAIMAEYLRETHDYLFNVNGVRDTIRARIMDGLHACRDEDQRIVVGHSQGTFMAYDVMTAVADCPPIDGFMTIGSPLGIDEVQDHLVWSREEGFPDTLQGEWVNMFDSFDLISRPDPCLANDFKKNGKAVIVDIQEENWGFWRHSATKYLKGPILRTQLRRLCGREEEM